MGVDLGKLIEPEEIELEDLSGKKIAIDALNTIYQFLSIVRQPDGTPLMDSKGNVTSHLSGLFYRTLKMMELGIVPCYVFDGKPPHLKTETLEKRHEIREQAKEKWEQDKQRLKDIENLGYKVFLIWENDWKTNKSKIISKLRILLNETSN